MMKQQFFLKKTNAFIFLEGIFTKAKDMPVLAGRLVHQRIKLTDSDDKGSIQGTSAGVLAFFPTE